MRPRARQAFEEQLQHAESLQREGHWEEAAHTFCGAASLAIGYRAFGPACVAFGAAGEAFRRADRVEKARDMLRLALTRHDDEGPTGPYPTDTDRVLYQVRLSSCLTELGNGPAALQLLEGALSATPPGSPLHVLVADADFGTRLGFGDLSDLHERLPALESNAWSHQLREAQWLRLQARLPEADAGLARLEAQLEGVEGAAAGLGGVRSERAEIAALMGDPAGSAVTWAESAADHERAGRTSLMWRAEAGRVRCLVEAGVVPFPNRLDEGMEWAANRRMVTLRIDLALAAAIARSDGARLAQVRDQALEVGLARRAGRAELARAALLDGMNRMAPLQRAEALLAGDRPYELRARVLHAETLAGVSRSAGVTAAQRLVDALETAAMAPELARVRALLEG
ncbi:MAG: hypothetical protein R3F61_11000 [Myxococcota bacterium]